MEPGEASDNDINQNKKIITEGTIHEIHRTLSKLPGSADNLLRRSESFFNNIFRVVNFRNHVRLFGAIILSLMFEQIPVVSCSFWYGHDIITHGLVYEGHIKGTNR